MLAQFRSSFPITFVYMVNPPMIKQLIDFQQIPSDIQYDPNATPPQYTDNADQVIEKGTHIRIKIMGIRPDVGKMYAIGSIQEDYLGYVPLALVQSFGPI